MHAARAPHGPCLLRCVVDGVLAGRQAACLRQHAIHEGGRHVLAAALQVPVGGRHLVELGRRELRRQLQPRVACVGSWDDVVAATVVEGPLIQEALARRVQFCRDSHVGTACAHLRSAGAARPQIICSDGNLVVGEERALDVRNERVELLCGLELQRGQCDVDGLQGALERQGVVHQLVSSVANDGDGGVFRQTDGQFALLTRSRHTDLAIEQVHVGHARRNRGVVPAVDVVQWVCERDHRGIVDGGHGDAHVPHVGGAALEVSHVALIGHGDVQAVHAVPILVSRVVRLPKLSVDVRQAALQHVGLRRQGIHGHARRASEGEGAVEQGHVHGHLGHRVGIRKQRQGQQQRYVLRSGDALRAGAQMDVILLRPHGDGDGKHADLRRAGVAPHVVHVHVQVRRAEEVGAGLEQDVL
mmetsp:Transcript_44730/g.75258  ORF Transcript_44730/g.75258 Transcript_44730/m.75258 type:complete len:415 (+) Transcript_44730:672-1916(+)